MSKPIRPSIAVPVLSAASAKVVNWEGVDDAVGALSARYREDMGAVAPSRVPLSEDDRARLRAAFAKAGNEFAHALRTLRRGVNIAGFLAIVCCGLAVAGAALMQITVYAGVISIAGILGLLGAMRRAWSLARDQAMLEVVPARYGIAAELCQTQEDLQRLIDLFLAETSSMRRGASTAA